MSDGFFDDCIVLAGGSGTRLWPASSCRLPKQFLQVRGKSLFTAAIERALAVIRPEGRVIIVAGADHVLHIIEAVAVFRQADRDRMILIPEPRAKNTAAAILCGSVYAGFERPRNILVITSDHVIEPLEAFSAAAVSAGAFADQNMLVVFGISPLSPETGYGYIETAESLVTPSGGGAGIIRGVPSPMVYRAVSFREKPDLATAESFLTSRKFYWNLGMFAFLSSFIKEEFRRSAPDFAEYFERLSLPGRNAYTTPGMGGLRVLSSWPGLADAYRMVRNISFDYVIAQKCARMVMVAAGFDWYDVGSWDEYARLVHVSPAEYYADGAKNCFVDADIPVALCGVEDLIVVARSGKDGAPPSVLISRRGETQRVKAIVEQIRTSGKTDLL